MTITKLIWALAGSVAVGLQEYLGDGRLSSVELVTLIGMLLAALGTWLVPNTPALATAKTWVTALVSGTAVLTPLLVDGVTTAEIFTVVIAVLTAAGVYAVPNRPALGAA